MQKQVKAFLSFENAIKNIPPEVVKPRNRNSPGVAGQMVRTGVMLGTNMALRIICPCMAAPKQIKGGAVK